MKQSSVTGIFLTWALLTAGVMSIRLVPFRIWELAHSKELKNVGNPIRWKQMKTATAANEREYPYMIFLFYDVKDRGWFKCSASLIKPNWVLTAAHCFTTLDIPPENVFLVGGKSNLEDYRLKRAYLPLHENINESEFGVEERRARKIFIHSDYTWTEDKITHDIALLQLQEPFTSYVKPIPLSLDKIMEKKTCTILGWGVIPKGQNFQLHVVREKEISTTSIGCEFENSIPLICLRADGLSGICRGDSGSPLVCEGKVWGVASYMLTQSEDCGESLEEYYTELSAEKDWIRSVLNGGIRSLQISLAQVFLCAFATLWTFRTLFN